MDEYLFRNFDIFRSFNDGSNTCACSFSVGDVFSPAATGVNNIDGYLFLCISQLKEHRAKAFVVGSNVRSFN